MTLRPSAESLDSEALVNLNEDAYKNIFGDPLQTCSKPGMALTGFTRKGTCIDSGDDDAGAHHICIQMEKDFCTVTGQPDWCESEMQCMGQAGKCPIGNWCVCQWAFATYLHIAGGCDKIVELQCDAINMAALKAYEKSTEPMHKTALACIKSRCNAEGNISRAGDFLCKVCERQPWIFFLVNTRWKQQRLLRPGQWHHDQLCSFQQDAPQHAQ